MNTKGKESYQNISVKRISLLNRDPYMMKKIGLLTNNKNDANTSSTISYFNPMNQSVAKPSTANHIDGNYGEINL